MLCIRGCLFECWKTVMGMGHHCVVCGSGRVTVIKKITQSFDIQASLSLLFQVFWRSSQWMWEWWPSGASAVTTTWQSARRESCTERWVVVSWPAPFHARWQYLVHLKYPLLLARTFLLLYIITTVEWRCQSQSKSRKRRHFFSLKWWLCGFEFSWMLFKTMDKASRLFIPETGTAVSQCELSSLLPTSVLQLHSETGNTILQFLYSASVPLGKAALISLSFSLLFFISFSPSLFTSFPYFERTQTSTMSLWSHNTDEMTHGRKERKRGILLHGLKLNSHDVFCSVQHKP